MTPRRIDVHSHFLPPDYRKACLENGHSQPDGMPKLPEWSEEAHVDVMSRVGITKAILSISSPGTHLVPGNSKLASTVTRYCNIYAASLKKKRPSQFGYFASLPLPDVDLTLAEIPIAIAEGCDGFALETNHHGHYLGDPLFDPVFEELNKRRCTVFIHPTTPCIARSEGKAPISATPLAASYPNPLLEFLFDTARCVTKLFLSGTVRRFPDITYILPHCGGAVPPILSRFTGFSSLVPGPWNGVSEADTRQAFNEQFYFDTAGFAFADGDMLGSGQLVGLVNGAGVSTSRLLYGSDYPFTNAGGVEKLAAVMDEGAKAMFTEEEIEALYHGNAEKLFSDQMDNGKL
ncbi:hypothetical protein BDV97DRAFT_290806 [Delphinella strobiligena]|nr:hypothetical protein BDV97DRAFT_290806 [Delphinella strobiligena]